MMVAIVFLYNYLYQNRHLIAMNFGEIDHVHVVLFHVFVYPLFLHVPQLHDETFHR